MGSPVVSYDTDRLCTVPNALSLLRLACLPAFMWLALGRHADGWAVVALLIAAGTDFVDGRLARRLRQRSRVGEMLDPFADRLTILVTLLTLALRGIIPWWLVVLLVGRDLLLAGLVPALRSRGFTSLPVHFLGKAATFLLLAALPVLLLGAGGQPGAGLVSAVGWAAAIWGAGLYWWAAVLYAFQTGRVVREWPRVRGQGRLT